MLNIEVLRNIARNRVKNKVKTESDLIELLKIWWSGKFGLPDNHPLFLEKTIEELVIDYFTDKFLQDRQALATPTVEDLKRDEEELKEKMGDDYHEECDFLVPPTAAELKGGPPPADDDRPDIIEEDFTEVRTIMDG